MDKKEKSKLGSILATVLAVIFGIFALIYTVIAGPVFSLYIAYMVYTSEPFEKDLLKDNDGYFIASLADANNWAFHAKYPDKHVVFVEDFLVAELPPWNASKQYADLKISGIESGGYIVIRASDYDEFIKSIAANVKIQEKNEIIRKKDVNYNPADLGSIDDLNRMIISRFGLSSRKPEDEWKLKFMDCILEKPCHAAMQGTTMPESFLMRGFVYAWSIGDKNLVRDITWKKIVVKKSGNSLKGSLPKGKG